MTPQLPAAVGVLVTANGRALPGAIVEIELPTKHKNNFRFPVGPTTEDGRVHISGSELAERARKINDLFPMDYVGLDASWTGVLIVEPVNHPGLKRLRAAHATWAHTGFYPEDFPAQLDRLASTLSDLATDTTLAVAITTDPPGTCRTTTRSARV
jgi:hypothetical protein